MLAHSLTGDKFNTALDSFTTVIILVARAGGF